jgi:hypothetical protein
MRVVADLQGRCAGETDERPAWMVVGPSFCQAGWRERRDGQMGAVGVAFARDISDCRNDGLDIWSCDGGEMKSRLPHARTFAIPVPILHSKTSH